MDQQNIDRGRLKVGGMIECLMGRLKLLMGLVKVDGTALAGNNVASYIPLFHQLLVLLGEAVKIFSPFFQYYIWPTHFAGNRCCPDSGAGNTSPGLPYYRGILII